MHYSSSRERYELWIMKNKSVEESSGPISSTRMNNQITGFINYKNTLVIVNNIKRYLFWSKLNSLINFYFKLYLFATFDLIFWRIYVTVQSYKSVSDPLSQARSGKLRKQYSSHLIKSTAFFTGWNFRNFLFFTNQPN